MTWPENNDKDKDNDKTNTFREHLQGAILENCDLWDIWSEWLKGHDMTMTKTAKLSFIIILLFDAKILIDVFVLVEIIIILLSINIINRISSIVCLNKAFGLTFKNLIEIFY